MKDLSRIKEVAVDAAKAAGEYAVSMMGNNINIKHKSGMNDLVTDVDKASEKMIIGKILDAFPEHSILAEESGSSKKNDPHCWVIDPLDGTTNYSHGFPFFCTSIGVMVDGEVQVGVVFAPFLKELFVAEKGKGAYLNGDRISVSEAQDVISSLVVTGFAYNVDGKLDAVPYFVKMLRYAQAVRRVGAAALDLCYVACGRFDAFWEFDLNPWDIAAGQLIVTEAGGKISSIRGGDLDFEECDIVASNQNIFDEFMEKLNS